MGTLFINPTTTPYIHEINIKNGNPYKILLEIDFNFDFCNFEKNIAEKKTTNNAKYEYSVPIHGNSNAAVIKYFIETNKFLSNCIHAQNLKPCQSS